MDNKIVEKIQKLLALSESSNEFEAQASMMKAQQLLVKHKMSLKEVKEFKTYNSAIKDKKSNISFTKAKWKAELANLIADNFGCYNYFRTRRTNVITFFGREEDVLVCNIVLEYAIDCISANVRRIKYEYIKEGYSTKGLESDYALGFIKGLGEMFEEQKTKNQEWGLVLVKDKEVVEAYSNKQFKGSINIGTEFKGHRDVLMRGFEDGKIFNISDKITEGDADPILEIM